MLVAPKTKRILKPPTYTPEDTLAFLRGAEMYGHVTCTTTKTSTVTA